ncbi:hypothetical protein [Pseudoruegeria sp. HB172150]|uniref:hypothetical protein n=1 Tax=Pseudoruegeria sp. HB172150 TaxID=2721164 RepID=UPI001552FC61|nr:hypothetical protein [Pseudoruegeria sp. HB172150]
MTMYVSIAEITQVCAESESCVRGFVNMVKPKIRRVRKGAGASTAYVCEDVVHAFEHAALNWDAAKSAALRELGRPLDTFRRSYFGQRI